GGKTAALFANATEGGALLAGCDKEMVEAMRTYGYSLGMAFQIVDDILDFTGDEELMGKPVGSDLLEGTITLPGLLLLERYPRDNPIKKFFAARRGREERLQEAIALVRSTEVLDVSMEMAREYVQRANEALVSSAPDTEARRTMLELGEYVLNRKS
ncbi:MAG: polyprenyl synthetase family protein, partial [Dehalococcoidia bacterium]|nr:polyprenyl synthetase family protein [Dehalococcoidia bacterium]